MKTLRVLFSKAWIKYPLILTVVVALAVFSYAVLYPVRSDGAFREFKDKWEPQLGPISGEHYFPSEKVEGDLAYNTEFWELQSSEDKSIVGIAQLLGESVVSPDMYMHSSYGSSTEDILHLNDVRDWAVDKSFTTEKQAAEHLLKMLEKTADRIKLVEQMLDKSTTFTSRLEDHTVYYGGISGNAKSSNLMSMCRFYWQRALLHARAGDYKACLRDVARVSKINRMCRKSVGLYSYLTYQICEMQLTILTRDLLHKGVWGRDDLRLFRRHLSTKSSEVAFIDALVVEAVHRLVDEEQYDELESKMYNPSSAFHRKWYRLDRFDAEDLLPPSYDKWQWVIANDFLLENLLFKGGSRLATIDHKTYDDLTRAIDTYFSSVQRWQDSAAHARCMLMAGQINQMLEFETGKDSRLLAIDCELYKLDKGEYPKLLIDLIPEYRKSLPLDRFTGNPLAYRLGDKGRPMFYSFGYDKDDDKGSQSGNYAHDGDIAWRYFKMDEN